jgi:type I restriction enzyme, S subunit
MNHQHIKLRDICDFLYGDGLPEAKRKGGTIPVYGSNGIVGWHNKALTKGKTIIIGRKGSIGEVRFSELPCWPIDTYHSRNELGKRGIFWHTQEHERRPLDYGRAHR